LLFTKTFLAVVDKQNIGEGTQPPYTMSMTVDR
jgi:hypothetical protein